VRGADARSRERHAPEGVTHGFQVSVYKVDPRACSLARNLLSKDFCRVALADEPGEVRPQVPGIVEPGLLSGGAEWLAGATSGPHFSVVGPSGESQGERPASNA
jgi:hypothetical protein